MGLLALIPANNQWPNNIKETYLNSTNKKRFVPLRYKEQKKHDSTIKDLFIVKTDFSLDTFSHFQMYGRNMPKETAKSTNGWKSSEEELADTLGQPVSFE